MLHFCQNNVGGSVGMATPYDDTFKTFISENAQDFASWLVKGAQVQERALTKVGS